MHTNVKNREMRSNAHKYKDEIKKGLEFVKKVLQITSFI